MIEIKEPSWKELLKEECEKEYFRNILIFLEKEYKNKTIFPPQDEIFAAINNLPYSKVKVVILGQDPYHGDGQAHGLAFSVKDGVKIPPSLRNIFKELKNEYEDFQITANGNLNPWVKEGILLLNSVLTVEEGNANSHKKIGWEIFTDKIISLLNLSPNPIVFLLWGNSAIQKGSLISNPNHLVLKSVHPSPLSASRGFFGNNHFKDTNSFLKSKNITPINWNL